MRHSSAPATGQVGFTLVELMIVVAVAAVLAMVALPMYQDSVRKSRRSEATTALTQLQQAQERHRANNPAYAATFAAMAPQPASATANYTLSIASAATGSYTISATAAAASPQFADTRCRTLTVVMSGGNATYQSTDDGGTVDTANTNRCWAR